MLADSATGARILEALRARYRGVGPEEPIRRRLYLETVDRRLWARGMTLQFVEAKSQGRVVWSSIDEGNLRSVHCGRAPAFAVDFEAGPMRDALTEIVDVRRLLPVAEARPKHEEVALRDKQQKTIARAAVEEWKLPGKRRGTLALRLAPVRGYEKEYRGLVSFVREQLGGEDPAAQHPLAAFGLLDAALGAPPPKLAVKLEAAARTDESAKRIFLALLAAIEANEAGTKDALDAEFLHEFRVAVRRTRAALSRFRNVYPVRTTQKFAREFKWLGNVTGPLRDLDVYLIKYDDLANHSGPEPLGEQLKPLHAHLEQHQMEERAVLRRHLESARYKRLLRDWRAFLEQPVPARTTMADARRPIGEVARERIWKLHQRVLKRGRRIDDDTPAVAVHDLRLDCKKLRYMMEFCKSLFDDGAMRDHIRALKRLQENLGDFNDLEVQQDKLRTMAVDMEAEGRAPLETAMAMGRLVEALRERQDEERRRFAARFTEFDSKKNRARAEALFRPRRGVSEE
ncbi:MAG: CHAD domain-containing protein [Planctomycetota bacterium]